MMKVINTALPNSIRTCSAVRVLVMPPNESADANGSDEKAYAPDACSCPSIAQPASHHKRDHNHKGKFSK